MSGDLSVMVLQHNTSPNVQIFWDIDFPSEVEQALDFRPLIASDRSGVSLLEFGDCPSQQLFQISILECPSDIMKDILFLSLQCETLECSYHEQL